MEVLSRYFRPPKQSFFLFGPRGTGKSTLVKRLYNNALYLDLLQPRTFQTFSAHPEHLKELLLVRPRDTTVLIDEIQRVPELLPLVHSLMETDPSLTFVLTGSSSRKLKRSGVDLLAGRALLCTLHPFMASELGGLFDLEKALNVGLLPVVFDSAYPRKALRTYVALYIKEEVQTEGLLRNVGNFARFLEAVSFSHASILNVSNVARECEVERKLVENYVSIMEDLLLSYRLPVFTRRASRALVSHPKFYIFDAGVYAALRPRGPVDSPDEMCGHALEGMVAQHLKAWMAYSDSESELYFWRTRSGVEVDFVLYGQEGFYAIEVKNATRVHSKGVRSLRTFQQDYPQSRLCLLYRGNEKLLIGNVLCVPCEHFLRQLKPGQTLDEAFEQ